MSFALDTPTSSNEMKLCYLGPARRALGILLLFGVSTGGCDLFDSGGPSYAGLVVDAETGEAVEGIQVSLKDNASDWGYVIVAEDLTDPEGRFRLRDPLDRASPAILFVNAPNYSGPECPLCNVTYFGGVVDYNDQDRRDIRIELERRR